MTTIESTAMNVRLFSAICAVVVGFGPFVAVAMPPARPPAEVRIALIGDSTVSSYEKPLPEKPDLTGWGQVFGEFFDETVEVRNFAVSGASSKSFLQHGFWQPVLDARPDYVFIQFGHNDQPAKWDRSTDPDGDFQDNLRKYIDEARAAHAKPVLVTSVARRRFENGRAVTTLTPYVEAMKKVAREKHVRLVDLHAASFALYDRLGDEATADLTVTAEDRTHFSRRGARVMARLVAQALPRAVPELVPVLAELSPSATGGDFEEMPGSVRLLLPKVIDAVVGKEANLYFDNCVLAVNPANYLFDVDCPKGKQQQERWTFVPVAGDEREHPLRLTVRNEKNRIIAQGRSTVRVLPADAGSEKELSLLLIGDSLTHGSIYPQRVLALCEGAQNPKLSLVGSHTPSGVPPSVRHEGYGGWTAHRFATHFAGTPRQGEAGKRSSPFLYPDASGKPQLDFVAYCKDVNGGKFPDCVGIFLGPNDVFSFNDETIEGGIDTMLEHYDALVRMVRNASSETRVAVMLPVPPAASQDAFGANYASGQTRWQYKRNQHRLVERMTERYVGHDAERVYLVPTYINLDCQHNYPAESAPWNAALDEKGMRQNNGVHPAKSGYDQIGDTLYAWLKGMP